MNTALFTQTLIERVDSYFKKNAISIKGNSVLYTKTVFWLLLWFTLYSSMYLPIPGWVKLIILCPLLGGASAGIGFNIMHDASHRAYSEKDELNMLFALTLELVGPISFLWLVKHVFLHHSFVNTDHDDDIVAGKLLRMSPHQRWFWFHRYQHIYCWPLYGFLAIQWIYIADFEKYFSRKIHTRKIKIKTRDHFIFWTAKLCHFIFFIFLPIYFYGKIVLIGLFLYLFTVGLLISVVFQLAHIHQHATFEETNEKGKLKKNFYIHQLQETLDFATKNKVLTWLLGGLNFQTIHHLFPQVSHVHYADIQLRVKQTCEEFGAPYFEVSGGRALALHYLHMKKMGERP